MNKQDLELIAVTMMRGARLNFNRDGRLQPVAFVVPRDRRLIIVTPESMRNALEKEAYAQTLGELCREADAVAILQLHEAWASPPEKGLEALAWHQQHGTLETYPHRIEVIYCLMETDEGVTHWQATINRPVKGKPTLGPWEKYPARTMEGRFTHMLSHLQS